MRVYRHTHAHTFFFIFFSIIVYRRILNIAPCAVKRLRVRVLSHFSRVRLFATLWAVGHQAPLSMGFSRPEYWSGVPCPPPGDLPDPGIEPEPLTSPALAGGFSPAECRLGRPGPSILYVIACICWSQTASLFLLHLAPPWQLRVCFLCLWVWETGVLENNKNRQ